MSVMRLPSLFYQYSFQQFPHVFQNCPLFLAGVWSYLSDWCSEEMIVVCLFILLLWYLITGLQSLFSSFVNVDFLWGIQLFSLEHSNCPFPILISWCSLKSCYETHCPHLSILLPKFVLLPFPAPLLFFLVQPIATLYSMCQVREICAMLQNIHINDFLSSVMSPIIINRPVGLSSNTLSLMQILTQLGQVWFKVGSSILRGLHAIWEISVKASLLNKATGRTNGDSILGLKSKNHFYIIIG